jgi:hypothetical protein
MPKNRNCTEGSIGRVCGFAAHGTGLGREYQRLASQVARVRLKTRPFFVVLVVVMSFVFIYFLRPVSC